MIRTGACLQVLDGDSVMESGLPGVHLIIEDHLSHLFVPRPHVENKRVLHHQSSIKWTEPGERIVFINNSHIRKSHKKLQKGIKYKKSLHILIITSATTFLQKIILQVCHTYSLETFTLFYCNMLTLHLFIIIIMCHLFIFSVSDGY